MPQVPPTYSGLLSDSERALVAGFLLHVRGQILRGLLVARDPSIEDVNFWRMRLEAHFQGWESCTRYLAWLLGYKVEKDQQYPEFEDGDNATARAIRDAESRGWID